MKSPPAEKLWSILPALAMLCGSAGAQTVAPWGAFRGNGSTGVAAESRAPARLDAPAWKVKVPSGLSAPVVAVAPLGHAGAHARVHAELQQHRHALHLPHVPDRRATKGGEKKNKGFEKADMKS